MTEIKHEDRIFLFKDSPITFRLGKKGKWMNATEMAKPFGKRVRDWLITQQAQDFMRALSETRNLASADLQVVIKGGNSQQGTWFIREVALEFARWLDPGFSIWCNDRILELANHGITVVDAEQFLEPDFVINALQRLKAERQEKERLIAENAILKPKALHLDNLMDINKTISLSVAAKELGFGLGRNKFYSKLRELELIRPKSREPYQKAIDAGWLTYKRVAVKDTTGSVKFHTNATRITEKGMYHIAKKLGVYKI